MLRAGASVLKNSRLLRRRGGLSEQRKWLFVNEGGKTRRKEPQTCLRGEERRAGPHWSEDTHTHTGIVCVLTLREGLTGVFFPPHRNINRLAA